MMNIMKKGCPCEHPLDLWFKVNLFRADEFTSHFLISYPEHINKHTALNRRNGKFFHERPSCFYISLVNKFDTLAKRVVNFQ